MVESIARVRHIRVTPQKARRVVALIKGKQAQEALAILKFAPQAASEPVGKALASAPPARGVGLLFWMAPPFLGAVVLLAIAAALRGRVSEDKSAASGGDAASTAAITARLDEELGDLD